MITAMWKLQYQDLTVVLKSACTQQPRKMHVDSCDISDGSNDPSPPNTLDVTNNLIGLKAARHTIFVDATAAIGQAAFTNVLSGAGSIDVTAAINQQVFSLADITCKTLTQMSTHWLKLQNSPIDQSCYYHCMVVSNVCITHQVRLWSVSSPGWSFCTE